MPSPHLEKLGSPAHRKSPRKEKEADNAPKAQKAFKYQYNAEDETWSRTECSVLVAHKAFQEGGMRYCYKMYEIGIDGQYAPGVAKIFKPDVSDDEEELTKAYFDEAMTQTVADSFARQFNHRLPETHKTLQCRFLPVQVLHLTDQGHTLCNAEPYLSGQYMKHNDNDGHVESDLELPQAFSHFTWEASNQSLLVCDIQGVGNYYTDPQIHSHDGEGFGMGNIGQDGIDKFLNTHKCNSICKLLGLVQPRQNSQGGWISKNTQAQIEKRRTQNSAKESWSSLKYKGVMQKAITKLKDSFRADKTKQTVNDLELTLQQQKLLQEKLMRLVEQKGSLENQMLMSPKRDPTGRRGGDRAISPLGRGAVSPLGVGRGRSRDDLSRPTSSFEWDGSVDDTDDAFHCKHCGVSGTADSVAAHGKHHSRLCPRRQQENGKMNGREQRGSSEGRERREPEGRERRGSTEGRERRGSTEGRERRGSSEERERQGSAEARERRGSTEGRGRRGSTEGRETRGSTEERERRGSTEGRERRGSSEGRERRGSTEGRERQGSSEERERRGSTEGRGRRGSTEGRERRGSTEGREGRGSSEGRESTEGWCSAEGKERRGSTGRWCSAEVQRLQRLLEAQSVRIKGLDMGELRLRCYDYDRP